MLVLGTHTERKLEDLEKVVSHRWQVKDMEFHGSIKLDCLMDCKWKLKPVDG